MKICPHCNATNVEKYAIKCEVCGQLIKDEQEYSIEDYEKFGDTIKQYNVINQVSKKNKKLILILSLIFGLIIIIVSSILIYNSLKPKGHISIKNSIYIMYVGDRIEIAPEYYGDITAHDLKMDIDLKSKTDNVPFRYEIIDNKFYIDAFSPDEITITFIPNDDGNQKMYNNIVKIYILSKTAGDMNE